MTKQQFKADAVAKGWKPDKYSHVQHKLPDGGTYRLKLQKISWRKEFKRKDGDWCRVGGTYYTNTDAAPVLPVPRPSMTERFEAGVKTS